MVAQDGPVFVGVGQVGVEVFGQPRFGVERQEPQDHLQAAAGEVGAGSFRVRVQVGGQDLGRYGFQRRSGVFDRGGGRLDPPVCRWGSARSAVASSACAAASVLRAAVRAGLVTLRVSGPMSMAANASMPLCSAAYVNMFSIRQRARSQYSSPAAVAVVSLVRTCSTGASFSNKVSWRASPYPLI